jgi:hypothetical protein
LTLLRYSRACAQHSDFLNIVQLLIQNLLKHGYVAPKLKSSLQKFYGRHGDLKYPYLKWQLDLLLFTYIFLSFIKNDPTQSKKNYKSNMVIRKGHIVNNNDTNIVLRGNCARNCSSYMTQITDIDLLHYLSVVCVM